MVKLIVGNKGSGKTKRLIDMANQAVKTTNGNVVCVEKGLKLTYDLDYAVRLVDIENYNIHSYDSLYGFLAGLLHDRRRRLLHNYFPKTFLWSSLLQVTLRLPDDSPL